MNAAVKSSACRRRMLLAGAYAAAGIAAAWPLFSCGGARQAASKPAVLVVSGDTQGWITPCGCTVNQSGGLPRRASFLASAQKDHQVIYADVGGVIDGTSDYHALKAEAIFRGEMEMHLAVQNIGGAELALGPERLRAIEKSAGPPFVSANAAPASGEAVGLPARMVAAGALRVAFVGVVSPKFATDQWRVSEPRQAILRAAGAIKGKYDRLIVLAYMDEAELDALARGLPEADAVIGGPTGQSIAPHRVGTGGAGTIVGSATRQGKFLLEMPLQGASTGEIVDLSDVFAGDAQQLQSVAKFREELAKRDYAASSTGLAPGAGRLADFAGTASCAACHATAYDVWQGSRHARAWETLAEKQSQADPSCQICHTTGYAAPHGFQTVAASQAMVNVGCEDCHGPSEAHVKDWHIKTPFRAASQCITCHDEENSPTFDFDDYWRQIEHGEQPATNRGEGHP